MKVYVCKDCGGTVEDRARVVAVYEQYKTMDSKHVKSRKNGHLCIPCGVSRGLSKTDLEEHARRIEHERELRDMKK